MHLTLKGAFTLTEMHDARPKAIQCHRAKYRNGREGSLEGIQNGSFDRVVRRIWGPSQWHFERRLSHLVPRCMEASWNR